MMRRCGACHEVKCFHAFAWRRKAKRQRDNYCRPCRAVYKQRHYAANKQRYIDNAAMSRKRRVEANTIRLLAFLEDHPCVDCGESDPIVLEFDHVGEKRFGIATQMRLSDWSSILPEIATCDVVCANCHRRRTARRGGFIRLVLVDRKRAGDPAGAVAKLERTAR